MKPRFIARPSGFWFATWDVTLVPRRPLCQRRHLVGPFPTLDAAWRARFE